MQSRKHTAQLLQTNEASGDAAVAVGSLWIYRMDSGTGVSARLSLSLSLTHVNVKNVRVCGIGGAR